MAGLIDVVYFMIAGFNLMVIAIGGVAFFQAGFFGPYFKVKSSRGKKLLLKVLHPVQSYFRAGKLEEGFLVYKDRTGNERRIEFQEGCIDRCVGVYWATVDDEKNCMVRRFDGKGLDSFDAVKYDELYKRALYKPDLMDDRLAKLTLVLLCVIVIVMVAVAVMTFKNMQAGQELLSAVQGLGVGVVN